MRKHTRKIISLLLIFPLLIVYFLQFDLSLNKVYAYDNSDVVVTAETFEQGQDIAELVANLEPRVGVNESYYYYYNQLTDVEKAIYQCMEKATLDNPLIVLKGMGEYTDGELGIIASRCLKAYVCDQPLARLYWEQYGVNVHRNGVGDTVIELMRESISSDYLVNKALDRIDAIVNAVPKGKDRYTTIINLSLYIAGTTEYSAYEGAIVADGMHTDIMSGITQSPIGLFCYGVDVCMGFAYSCKILCDKLGIPCVIIQNNGHAWNYIQMEDQKWYSIDWTYAGRYFDDMETFNNLRIHLISSNLLGANDPDNPQYAIDWRYGNEATLEVGNVPELSQLNYHYAGKYDYEFGDVPEYVEPDARFVYTPNEDGVACTITGYEGIQQGDLVIPSTIDGLAVTTIGESAFYRCMGFDGKLIIPDSVTDIKAGAFVECRNITEIVLSSNLKSIGGVAFAGCTGIRGDLMLPNSLESVGRLAFERLKCDGKLYIPSKISMDNLIDAIDQWTPFSEYVVYDDNTEYAVENGVLYSSDYATLIRVPMSFEGILKINENTTTVAQSACERCEHITDIVWPDNLKEIKKWAFRYCIGLMGDLILPDTIEIIGVEAFEKEYTIYQDSPDKAGKLHLPNNLKVLGDEAFRYGSFTGELIIPDSLEELIYTNIYSYNDGTFKEHFDAFGWNYFDKITYNCSNEIAQEIVRRCEDHVDERNAFESVHHGSTTTTRVAIEGIDNSYIEIVTCDTCSEEISRRAFIDDNEAEILVFGENIYGYLTTDKTLYVIGSGEMFRFYYGPYSDKVFEKVIFSDGITSISNYAFYDIGELESVEIPATVTSIGNLAFPHDHNINVYGTSGSYAEEYCAEYDNLTFIAGGMPTHTPGDINGDGKVNLKDVTRLKQYLLGWKVKVVEQAIDVNGDGKVNLKDVTRLKQYLLGWKVSVH